MILKKNNFDKVGWKITINWALVLAFVSFWVYGFYGGVSFPGKGFAFDLSLTIFLGLFSTLCLYAAYAFRGYFCDGIIFTKKDILGFGLYLAFFLIFGFGYLTAPLVGDELSHASHSRVHEIQAISLLGSKFQVFDNMVFLTILRATGFLTISIIGAASLIWRVIKRRGFNLKIGKRSFFVRADILAIFILFITVRLAVYSFSGGSEVHPPFRLFPLWFFSVIFTPSNVSFRLPQLFGLVILAWGVWRIVGKKLPAVPAWFFGLASATIPALWYVGVIVEPSIWTALGWVLFLLFFVTNNELSNIQWVRWFSFFAVISLARQPAFIAFLPLVVFFIFQHRGKITEVLSSKFFPALLLPIAIMAPFTLKSLITGTPATNVIETAGFPNITSSFAKIWLAISSGIAFKVIVASILLPWVFFLPLAFLPAFKKDNRIYTIIIGFFFAVAFSMFYFISPGLWGVGRYQVEYVAPFVVFGFFIFTNWAWGIGKLAQEALFWGLVVLTVVNIYTFLNLNRLNPPIDTIVQNLHKKTFYSDHAIISEFPYEYDRSYQEAKRAGFAESLYVSGSTYGNFGPILNGFTIGEIRALDAIYNGGSLALSDIQGDKRIKLVLISDMPNAASSEELKKLGWREWQNFKNEKWGSTIHGLVRSIPGK